MKFSKKLCKLTRERVSTGEPRTLNTRIILEVISQSNPILLYSSGETDTERDCQIQGYVEEMSWSRLPQSIFTRKLCEIVQKLRRLTRARAYPLSSRNADYTDIFLKSSPKKNQNNPIPILLNQRGSSRVTSIVTR